MANLNPGVNDQGESSNAERDQESSPERPPVKKLRSSRSWKLAFARFWNTSNGRRAKVLWLNYDGDRVGYRDILPYLFLDVNTFESHPWVFEDADTGDRLVASGQEVFLPLSYDRNKKWPLERQSVRVHIPVYTLQERCLQVIRDVISPEQIEQSNLPSLLRAEIRQAVDSKRRYTDPSSSQQTS